MNRLLLPLALVLLVAPVHAQTFTVTTTADTGGGSLRTAMDAANNGSNGSTIRFNISGPGPHTIRPATDLPRLVRAMTIDGYTQPGATPNTLAAGASNAVLRVEVFGQGTARIGFLAAVENITIRGLAIGSFPGGAISVQNGFFAVTGARIEGNFIGTDASGAVARPNGSLSSFAVLLGTGGSHTVGGTDPAARNVISGNAGVGVLVTATGSTAASSAGNQVVGNLIGTRPDGATALGNGWSGVQIGTCGGRATLVQGNTVAFNGTDPAALLSAGVRVDSNESTCVASFGNRILGNAVFGNADRGIVLFGFPTPQPGDPGDADGGANLGQNAPVLLATGLAGAGASVAVTYRVDSAPANATYPLRVEVFRALGGEGAALIGVDTYSAADYAGCGAPPCPKTATFAPAAPLAAGDAVVATATDGAGNTSEFSPAPGVVVAGEAGVPLAAGALLAPAPNPAAGWTTLRYSLAEPGPVRLAVVDLLGREVAVLAEGAQPAGRHEARLDAGRLAPGVYVVRLTAGLAVEARRLTVAR